MTVKKSNRISVILIDLSSIAISFMIAIGVRYNLLISTFGSVLVFTTYIKFFIYAVLIYVAVFAVKRDLRVVNQSYKEIFFTTVEQQIVFVFAYVLIFFLTHQADIISRLVVGIFFMVNVALCSFLRIQYHNHCIKNYNSVELSDNESEEDTIERDYEELQHVYILGSKSIGMYGGFESFVMNLLKYHKDNKNIKYHVACKANGDGFMDVGKLDGVMKINDNEFSYCNAHCFMITIPEKLGSAQAIVYDIKAFEWACNHIEKNHIEHPIVYILASRIGPFEKKFVDRVHEMGGLVYQNPDGHEDWRRKWNAVVRKYWKISEYFAVKNADLVICDSKNIEEYIKDEYSQLKPKTVFIPYGSYVQKETLSNDDPKYRNWLTNHGLRDGKFYISVGRFVKENNYDVMIREFMRSKTKKDFAIITTENEKFAIELQQKLNYKKDKRIKFVGTVYDMELLGKIRANAYGYLHGHEVGGTNPSLLESMGSTKLNLLFDVGFNREVALDSAIYWNKDDGNLAKLIDSADKMNLELLNDYGCRAKKRIEDAYTWESVTQSYEDVFVRDN